MKELRAEEIAILKDLKDEAERSVPRLAADTGLREEVVETSCHDLLIRRYVSFANTTRAGVWKSSELWRRREQIVVELGEAAAEEDEELATAELASRLERQPRKVYQDCRVLEQQGLTDSRLRLGSNTILFFPVTGEVVTSENRDRLDRDQSALKALIRAAFRGYDELIDAWVEYIGELDEELLEELEALDPREALWRALESYFDKMARLTRERVGWIEQFAEDLQEMILDDAEKSEILDAVGYRMFAPDVRFWRLTDVGEFYLE